MLQIWWLPAPWGRWDSIAATALRRWLLLLLLLLLFLTQGVEAVLGAFVLLLLLLRLPLRLRSWRGPAWGHPLAAEAEGEVWTEAVRFWMCAPKREPAWAFAALAAEVC